jgi:hypothetical protein
VFNQSGDLERYALRPGDVHSAAGWQDVFEPTITRYQQDEGRYFEVDATFANPEVYELLKTEDYKYTIRLPANSVLQERLLNRPVGHLPACGAPIFRRLPLPSPVMDHCIRASGLS